MSQTPTSTPVEDLDMLLAEVHEDSSDEAASIRARTQQFMGADNVSMMGGWT